MCTHTPAGIVEAENEAEIQDCRRDAAVADIDEEGCELIGESQDEVWFACKEGSGGKGVECESADGLGVGGGPGILPQDDQVLCIAKKPT